MVTVVTYSHCWFRDTILSCQSYPFKGALDTLIHQVRIIIETVLKKWILFYKQRTLNTSSKSWSHQWNCRIWNPYYCISSETASIPIIQTSALVDPYCHSISASVERKVWSSFKRIRRDKWTHHKNELLCLQLSIWLLLSRLS